MMARSFSLVVLVLAWAAGGCCSFPGHCGPGGPYGGAACLCLPKPILWHGACNDCGPGPCESCADCPTDCGLLPWLRRGLTCDKGCGEIYLGEWISDPPDCCDPCDQCGNWTGSQGYCCLGPFQRLLAALHGYRYCPPPSCGPVCKPLCHKPGCGPCGGACGPVCGCDSCGGAGCAGCGVESAHGADIYYQGPIPTPAPDALPPPNTQSILDENWDIPKTKPEPGKPIHKAQQRPQNQFGYRQPPQPARQHSNAGRPTVARRPVAPAGVQPANHLR